MRAWLMRLRRWFTWLLLLLGGAALGAFLLGRWDVGIALAFLGLFIGVLQVVAQLVGNRPIPAQANWPFEVVTPDELPDRFTILPLADQAHGYLPRLPVEAQAEMQRRLDTGKRLLRRHEAGANRQPDHPRQGARN